MNVSLLSCVWYYVINIHRYVDILLRVLFLTNGKVRINHFGWKQFFCRSIHYHFKKFRIAASVEILLFIIIVGVALVIYSIEIKVIPNTLLGSSLWSAFKLNVDNIFKRTLSCLWLIRTISFPYKNYVFLNEQRSPSEIHVHVSVCLHVFVLLVSGSVPLQNPDDWCL